MDLPSRRLAPPHGRPAAPVILTAVLLAACGGGGPGGGGPRFEPPLRLIAEAPTAAFEAARLHDEQVVFQLDLTTESEQVRWRRSDGAATGAIPRGVPVPAREESWLFGGVEGIAACDALEVDTTWVRGARLELLVAAEEPPEGTGAGAPAPLSAAGRELFERPVGTRFRFRPSRDGAEPAAVGGATTVALRRIGGEFMKVRRLTCLRRSADPEAAAEVLSKPWKVDLGGEVRFAVPARPGSPAAFRARLPEGAVLRFGYGVAGGTGAPPAVEVAAVPDGAGEGRVLFRAGDVSPGAWFDAEADLGEYAGREATLELRAVAADDATGPGAPAFFAHPVVVAAEERDARPPNVVLISVDTLRADHLELYGYGRRTMPHLTAWAEREAVVFENAVAQAPWTLPSHVSMLTGLDPLVHGVNYHHPAPQGLRLLSEILYERGYRTLAVTGGAYLDPQFGLDQGFERFRYYRGQGYRHELERGIEVAVEWLREAAAPARAGGPFFLFFHTYDVHEPYYARDPDYGAFSGDGEDYPPVVTRGLPPERELAFQGRRELTFLGGGEDGAVPDLERVRAMYDSGIAHTDRGLARLLGELEALGVAEETLVVFTSDHGEALGEHGLAGHGDLYDHTVMVPLIVRLPGGEGAGERIAEQVRSVDIVPTVLEALGLPAPAPIAGLSLLPLVRGARGLPEDAVVYDAIGNHGIAIRGREGGKYVLVDAAWKPTEAPTERLFDLATDPAELNGASAESADLRRFRRQAQRLLRDTATGLHVRLWNRADRPLCGVLAGDIFRPNSVKVPAAESFARWTGTGKAGLALPAGEHVTLIVLDTGGAWLPVDLRSRDCGADFEPARRQLHFGPVTIEAPLDDLSRPLWYRLEAGRWRPAPGGGGGADAVISLAWVGPALLAGGEDAEPVDGELEERLRALGYL